MNNYNFVKQIIPTISLEEVNALAPKMESNQGKFALIEASDKATAQLPSDTELRSIVAASHQLQVIAYE